MNIQIWSYRYFLTVIKSMVFARLRRRVKIKGLSYQDGELAVLWLSQGLVSRYTVAQFKPRSHNVNRDDVHNIIDQDFEGRSKSEVIVSDLTYVRVGNSWNYICVLVDLFNREIIGYSAGPRKTAQLVKEAFATVRGSLNNIQYFHSDSGMEFKSALIEELIDTFDISKSLSEAGVPYDNAVVEATFKSIKTEFVYPNKFEPLQQLKQELVVYVW